MNVPRTLEEEKVEQQRLIREIHRVVAKNPHLKPMLADVPPLPEGDELAVQLAAQEPAGFTQPEPQEPATAPAAKQ